MAIGITCNNPPSADIGTAYTHAFPATGDTPPDVFDIPTGALPAGLCQKKRLKWEPGVRRSATLRTTALPSPYVLLGLGKALVPRLPLQRALKKL